MVNMSQLIMVETRKMTDTRSTRTLLLLMLLVGLCIALLVMIISGSRGADLDFSTVVATLALPAALGAPIIGILGITGDWQHKDVMTYFALVPKRWKIFVAKILGTLLVSVAIVLGVLALSTLVSAVVAPMLGLNWVAGSLGNSLWLLLCSTILGSIAGAAIASLFLSAPLAMVFIVLQTLLFDTLIGLIPGGSGPYLQSASLINHLTDAGPALPALSSFAIWILLPLSVGFWRHQHKEVQ